eukprot:3055759-Pyramimonas_sp.AAC.1
MRRCSRRIRVRRWRRRRRRMEEEEKATMVVKRCSNLLKIIAQGTSSVLTYIFTIVPLHRGPRQWSYL